MKVRFKDLLSINLLSIAGFLDPHRLGSVCRSFWVATSFWVAAPSQRRSRKFNVVHLPALRRLRLNYINFLVIGVVFCGMLLTAPLAIAQTHSTEHSFGWKSYGLIGDVAFAPVRLDGQALFLIAAERAPDSGQWGLGALQIRRNRVENRLNAQLLSLMENASAGVPESLQVVTARLNQQYAVQVVADGKARIPIVTVTALDAEIYGLTEVELVEEYAQQIRQGLLRAVEERQPAAQQQHLKRAVLGGAITVLLVTLFYLWQRRMDKIRRQLRQAFHNQQASLTQVQTTAGSDRETSPQLSEQQNHLFELKRRIDRKTWQKRTLQLSMLGAGMIGMAWVLQRFPQTRSLGVLLFRQPLALFLIGIFTTCLIILSHLVIDRLLNRWVGTEDQLSLAQIDRRRRRLLVFSPVWKGVTTIFWVIAALVLAYSLVSISTGVTLFTQIGVLGLAISLAFQSTIKDALTGWILLARDAFTIGDIVVVKDASGVVEAMGVLITQIRNSAGELITIRNGEISQLTNCSKDWSRMDLTVLVDCSTDLKQAMIIMREVFQAMKTDPIWKKHLIGEPDIVGVEQFDQHGVLLKIRAQTEPGQQFGVSREFRLRLNQAFNEARIRIPLPQREVRY